MFAMSKALALRRCGAALPAMYQVRHVQAAASIKEEILGIEVAGEEYYRKLAQSSPSPLDQIFNRLADEEHEHHETLEEAFKSHNLPEFHSSDIVERMHNICEKIKTSQGVTDGMKSMITVYSEARDMEKHNRDHYVALAQSATNPETKALWDFLAEEEDKHYKAMDEMVQLVVATDIWASGGDWKVPPTFTIYA